MTNSLRIIETEQKYVSINDVASKMHIADTLLEAKMTAAERKRNQLLYSVMEANYPVYQMSKNAPKMESKTYRGEVQRKRLTRNNKGKRIMKPYIFAYDKTVKQFEPNTILNFNKKTALEMSLHKLRTVSGEHNNPMWLTIAIQNGLRKLKFVGIRKKETEA